MQATKMIFDQKMKDFFHLVWQPDEEIFVVLNPSGKDREKQCFIILILLNHNLIGKLIFSQNIVSKASYLIACFFWWFQMLILMLSNYTFDALLRAKAS